MRRSLVLVTLAAAVVAAAAHADTPRWNVWLCLPGHAPNYCNVNLSTTFVYADGTGVARPVYTPYHAPFDCFYVYPTVSKEVRGNADLRIQSAEKNVALLEAAQFEHVCRVFAPLYRQTTSYSGLNQFLEPDAKLAYGDVAAAWNDYLAHYNHGRGVVLIGHSEGAFRLEQLLADPKEAPGVRRVLVSAILVGGNVVLTHGRYAGFPACRSRTQTGCLVGYSTWNRTPPPDASFEHVTGAGERILCVNPAAPAGGSAAITPVFPWYLPEGLLSQPLARGDVKTIFLSFPGLYTARCVEHGQRSWLLVSRLHHAGDRRPTVRPILRPSWGLHAADIVIASAQLVSLAAAEAAAWRHRH